MILNRHFGLTVNRGRKKTIGMSSSFKYMILVLCLFLGPLPSAAQGAARIYRIGFLAFGPPPASPVPPTFPFVAFSQTLRELGYVEGQNLVVETRWAEGKPERLPAFAVDLVGLKVDIIVASGASAVRAAKGATRVIPIVMAGAPDPVAFELVASLSNPGGNVTGLSDSVGRDVEGKRLELLKETFPGISNVAVVLDSASRVDITPLRHAAKALGLRLILSPETATPEEFYSFFDLMIREGAQALYAPETPINVRYRKLIVELAAKKGVPAMYGSREFVDAGGLMAYGPSFADLFRRAAFFVDKILKGTKPAELPVEQPTRFELVINLKTAKALGISLPPEVVILADHVIK